MRYLHYGYMMWIFVSQMYLKQMEMLCQQQRLLCCQLHDSILPLIAPP